MRDFRLWLANRILDANWPGVWLRIRIARHVAPSKRSPYFTNRRSPSPIGPGNGGNAAPARNSPSRCPGRPSSPTPAKEPSHGKKSASR